MRINDNQHHIDFIFVLILFCLFSLCALTVVYIGSHIYSQTENTMEINYDNNTAMGYITEKVRQANSHQGIEVKTIHQVSILCIHTQKNNRHYTTYIYCYKNKLKELYINDEDNFDITSGEDILDVESLTFSIKDSLLKISITIHQKTQISYISIIGGKQS